MNQVSESNGHFDYSFNGQVDELSQIFGDYYELPPPVLRQALITEYFVPMKAPSPIDFSRYFNSEDDLVIPSPDYDFHRSMRRCMPIPESTPPFQPFQRYYEDIRYTNQKFIKPSASVMMRLNFGTESGHSWSEDDLQMD